MSTGQRILLGLVCFSFTATGAAREVLSHPRPSGYAETHATGEPAHVEFQSITQDAGFLFDLVAHFPKEAAPAFEVRQVILNGQPQDDFLVRNFGVINLSRMVHDEEDFSVSLYTGWTPGQQFTITIAGQDAQGRPVTIEQQASAPAERATARGLSLGPPAAEFPFHHARMTLAKEDLAPGTVTRVEVDGQPNRDARFFNSGVQAPEKAGNAVGLEGETFAGTIDGSRDFQVVVPVKWTRGSEHTVRLTVEDAAGQTRHYEARGKGGATGGYWDPAWPEFFSITLSESAGIARGREPVRVVVAPFADDIGDPAREIRVVTYDPTHPEAGADGYVVAPHQILGVTEWRDKAMLEHEERDAETGELIHRYDPTTTVELLFLADVLPYQKKVYQILYGNPEAAAPVYRGDLYVRDGAGLSQTIGNAHFEVFTAENSAALETVTVKGAGDPVLLEHKLETNGAVHWNPDFYSPPTPWVHVSDWEDPSFEQVTGPLMHSTSVYAPLPFMDNVVAHVAYTFYTGAPYIRFSTLMEVQEDLFVAALRNLEVVFNKDVLNEFVWLDEQGKVQSVKVEDLRLHPVHGMDISPRTQWMALINREQGIGFANIVLEYVNTNRYGYLPSEAQPYIYVQNGPWVYWSRGIVYPFAGNNMTRLMPVRKGSMYYEENAWLPFRFSEGSNPFAIIEETQQRLKNPLFVHEWMPTNKRAPEKWIMPILTEPFDEGVEGAVSGHKTTDGKE